jgi:hypothetical protein
MLKLTKISYSTRTKVSANFRQKFAKRVLHPNAHPYNHASTDTSGL